MAEQLTPQQIQAVYDRGGRLLVSAAAGSGKTKVLVERLISYITDSMNPANIDDFLIITYTKAAAAELRGKIASKLSELIATTGENTHLLQQLQRLHLTKISTVHSFCADILRENAYILNISSDFRVADEEECLALRTKAMDLVLEEVYSTQCDDCIYTFIDTQGFGRDDRRIPEIVLQVYNAAKCHLNPDEWLEKCINAQSDDSIQDVSQTIWGEYLIEDLRNYLRLQIETLGRCIAKANLVPEMAKPVSLLADTLSQLQHLLSLTRWDDIYANRSIDYGRLTFSKKCTDVDLVEQIKAIRDACKIGLNKRLSIFCNNSEQMLKDYRETLISAAGLISLVRKFDATYSKLKESRRVLDFSDLEHKTLDLLIGKSRSGATKIAGEIGQRFREVMVDEYQDSNEVQDTIFEVLTEQRQNCFMVGDVKQSIYQFRLADPSIFIDKYNHYVSADDAKTGQGRRVVLSQNFRSCAAVIDTVNDVFETCMSPQVGGLDYGENEALYEGIPHIPLNEPEVELYGIDVEKDTYQEEASFVANRISELLDGKHMVRQGDTLRPIKAEDIVILLRSPGSVGMAYQLALEMRGISCASGSGSDLMQTEEVEVLRSLLQVINNPLTDIPLVAVLMSRVFGFSADELAAIRKNKKYGSFYLALKASNNTKVKEFLGTLNYLRKQAQLCTVSQLLMQVFATTRIDSIFSAMPDGEIRTANLQQFCQIAGAFESISSGGLSKYLDYLDALITKGVPVSATETTTNAVKIMSIHKSKGLEFPVVFLCGLSRDFNMESTRSQVLCDKKLGLGLSCVDVNKRIQYPSIAKRAIAAKIRTESISEEMRVLYVAMTRAKDRLIMTYAAKNVADEMEDISLKMAFSSPVLLAGTADCPGLWILMTAYAKCNLGWSFKLGKGTEIVALKMNQDEALPVSDEHITQKLKRSLEFVYPHTEATQAPSKQTATQMKGREKDKQAAEFAEKRRSKNRLLRKPSFAKGSSAPFEYGTAMHAVMQYIHYDMCDSEEHIRSEIDRLVADGYITTQQATMVKTQEIAEFFATNIGKMIRNSPNIIREFKFSLLIDAENNELTDPMDRVLLQGVVDCAIIEDDGITILDFKTDRICADELEFVSKQYEPQVRAYADALSRIYQRPVKNTYLYFFHIASLVKVI